MYMYDDCSNMKYQQYSLPSENYMIGQNECPNKDIREEVRGLNDCIENLKKAQGVMNKILEALKS